METLEKIKDWIDRTYQEYPGAAIGIDEGGLEIRVFIPDTGDWYAGYELGGIPEEFPETDDFDELKEYKGPADDGLDYQGYLSRFDGSTDGHLCEYVHHEVSLAESKATLINLWLQHATPEELEEFGDEVVSEDEDKNTAYRGYMIACCRIIDYLRAHVKLEDD